MNARPKGLVFAAICVSLQLALTSLSSAESALDRLAQALRGQETHDGIASSNGRVEAQDVDVSSKYAGRLTDVLIREGQVVEAGEVLAKLDERDVQARLLAAKASVLQGKAAREQALAAVRQSESALTLAKVTFERIEKLKAAGHTSQAALDDAANVLRSAEASLAFAKAQVANGDALVAVAEANVAEINVTLEDMTIRSPIRGRVQYRLREPGEVIDAGMPIVTLLDLTDVYMNLYLPANVVGLLSMNDEARLILDPFVESVIPATITFIEAQAQFTPKSVETQEEREQLVFRVKLTIPRSLLAEFEDQVKTGVRGLGFVRTDPTVDWPDNLQVKLSR